MSDKKHTGTFAVLGHVGQREPTPPQCPRHGQPMVWVTLRCGERVVQCPQCLMTDEEWLISLVWPRIHEYTTSKLRQMNHDLGVPSHDRIEARAKALVTAICIGIEAGLESEIERIERNQRLSEWVEQEP